MELGGNLWNHSGACPNRLLGNALAYISSSLAQKDSWESNDLRCDILEDCLQLIDLFLQVSVATAPGITLGRGRSSSRLLRSTSTLFLWSVLVGLLFQGLTRHHPFVPRSVFPGRGPFG
ncbi:hypothetical protein LIER_00629 [Lithospermum erythrorhizon]|uniref:Uncharacterized protein n=1 Tax=Lithospermum erythrorhizon TaxID=34254 RepID=A0AAV3NIL5_LITER